MSKQRTSFRRLLRLRHGDRGAVAVEFALVAPIFLIFVLGLIDFGRLFWIRSTMQYAVEQASRYALVNSTATASQLVTYAGTQTSGMDLTGLTFSATKTASGGANYATITATYQFTFLIPIIPIGDITLDAKSMTPIE